MMAVHDEPMPKWLEDELAAMGFAPAPQPKQEKIESVRTPPPDRWWDRGEECPH